MRQVIVEGCPAFIIDGNLALTIVPDEEIILISRVINRDGVYYFADGGGTFETPINLKTFFRMKEAKSEVELLAAALAV